MEIETDLDLDPDLPYGAAEDIDQVFDACTAHVAAIAGGKELSQDDKLALYGYYKQATEGPCTTFRPSFFDRVARAKWYNSQLQRFLPDQAWKAHLRTTTSKGTHQESEESTAFLRYVGCNHAYSA